MDLEKNFSRRFLLLPEGYVALPQLHFSDL